MKKKRIIACICACIVFFTCFYPMQGILLVRASETVTETDPNGYTWEYEIHESNGETYTVITNIKNLGKTANVIVPAKLGGYPVREISYSHGAEELFYENANIVSVSLPSTIYRVDSKAFYNCMNLEKVTFASEDSKSRCLIIGSSTFASCSKLKEVTFPKGLQKLQIGSQAFDECSMLSFEEFDCPVFLDTYALYGCNLRNVVFKEDVTLSGSAMKKAFKEEDKVEKKVTFEKDVVMGAYMADAPLEQNPGLTEIVFKGDVTLCDKAFYKDINLKKITWGTGVQASFSSYNSNMGMNIFSNCPNLKTFEFSAFDTATCIAFEKFYGSFPDLQTVIYNGDVSTNYWIDAVNVIFKGKVDFTSPLSVNGSSTKNIYCYDWAVDFKNNFSATNVNFYGIMPNEDQLNDQYKLASFVKSQTGCVLKNIVSHLSVKAEQEYTVGDVKADTLNLSAKDLNTHVYANYVIGSQKEIVEIAEGDGCSGYTFSHDKLNGDSNNDFRISYSGLNTDVQCLIKYKTLQDLEVEVKKKPNNLSKQITVLEGENQLKKSDIVVTAIYSDGTVAEVTEDAGCVIQKHNITVGDNNYVTVTYTNPYSGQTRSKKIQVTGTAKTEQKELKITYKYPEGRQGVLVNTTLRKEDFDVRQYYDNGTYEILPPSVYSLKTNKLTKTGIQTVLVEENETKRQGTCYINGIGAGLLAVKYTGDKKIVGSPVSAKEFQVSVNYPDGSPVPADNIQIEDVQVLKTVILQEEMENGVVKIPVSYADRTCLVEIPVEILPEGTPTMQPEEEKTSTEEPKATPEEIPKQSVVPEHTPVIVVQTPTLVASKEPVVTKTPGKDSTPIPSKIPVTVSGGGVGKEDGVDSSSSSDTAITQPTKEPIVTIEPDDISDTPGELSFEMASFQNAKPVVTVKSQRIKYMITWKWNNDVLPDHYEVYYSLNKKNYKLITTLAGDKNWYAYSNDAALMGNKVYFKVIAKRTVGNTEISSQSSISVGKYLLDPVKNIDVRSSNHKLFVTWRKNKNCQGYYVTLTVRCSSGKKSKKIKVASKNKTTLVLTLHQLQKKFGVKSKENVAISDWSVQAYYKSGKTCVYSEK